MRTEGFRVLLQPSKADGAISGGIGRRQLANVNITEFHALPLLLLSRRRPLCEDNTIVIWQIYARYRLKDIHQDYGAMKELAGGGGAAASGVATAPPRHSAG